MGGGGGSLPEVWDARLVPGGLTCLRTVLVRLPKTHSCIFRDRFLEGVRIQRPVDSMWPFRWSVDVPNDVFGEYTHSLKIKVHAV